MGQVSRLPGPGIIVTSRPRRDGLFAARPAADRKSAHITRLRARSTVHRWGSRPRSRSPWSPARELSPRVRPPPPWTSRGPSPTWDTTRRWGGETAVRMNLVIPDPRSTTSDRARPRQKGGARRRLGFSRTRSDLHRHRHPPRWRATSHQLREPECEIPFRIPLDADGPTGHPHGGARRGSGIRNLQRRSRTGYSTARGNGSRLCPDLVGF